MSKNREKVAIYIMAKNKSQKRINREIDTLVQYCLCNNWDIVYIFDETGNEKCNKNCNFWYRKFYRERFVEMLKKRNFSKVVIFEINHLGNNSFDIHHRLMLIDKSNKEIVSFIDRTSINIYINDLIKKIISWIDCTFNPKTRNRNLKQKSNLRNYYREGEIDSYGQK